MSTILDALRKLQRERAAQSPSPDLRGSVTTESPGSRRLRRGAGSRRIAALLALLALGGAGYALYRSGQVQALLARFQAEPRGAAEAELAQAEAPAPPAQVTPQLRARAVRPPRPPAPAASAPPASAAPPAPADTPELAAERARLEAALANARAAQQAQRQAELEAAAQQAAAPPPPEPAAAPPPVAPPPAVAPEAAPRTAAPPAPVPAAKPKPVTRKPVAKAPAAPPAPERSAEPETAASAFPEVRVESIRWHPIAERRVASLHFERQDAPEAREGDIVAGVLVYRIDPGSVELRVGSAQRTVTPQP